MSGKNKAVFGIYKNRSDVESAVVALQAEGFSGSDISVLLPDESGSQEFAHIKGTKAPEGAVAGAGTGAVVGGTLGLLAGIGALAIPGIGPLIAAGPIMAALAGAGVMGTLGGASGALIGFGIPEYEAKKFEGHLKNGGVLLSVHTEDSDSMNRAKAVLESSGATDIASTGEIRGEAYESRPLKGGDKMDGMGTRSHY